MEKIRLKAVSRGRGRLLTRVLPAKPCRTSPASEALLLFGSTFTFLPLPEHFRFLFRSSPLFTRREGRKRKVFILVLITCERRLLTLLLFPPPSLVTHAFGKEEVFLMQTSIPPPLWMVCSIPIDRYPGGRYHCVDGLGFFCFCFLVSRADPGYFENGYIWELNDRRLTMWSFSAAEKQLLYLALAEPFLSRTQSERREAEGVGLEGAGLRSSKLSFGLDWFCPWRRRTGPRISPIPISSLGIHYLGRGHLPRTCYEHGHCAVLTCFFSC